MSTPLRSDDLISVTRPQQYRDSGQSLWAFFVDWLGPWVTLEGRFFPGSAAWTFAVFSVFTDRWAYKLFVAGLVVLAVLTVVVATSTLARTRAVAPVVVATAATVLTLRNFFDGLDSFSGILPMTVCMTIGAFALLLRGRGWATALLAACLFQFVLLSYEVAIVLAPTLCALVWWYRREWRRAAVLAVPTLATGLLVLYVRSMAIGSDGNAYRVNLEPWRVLVTYVKQAAGALPLSQQWYPGAAEMVVPWTWVAAAVVVVGLPVAALLLLVERQGVRVRGPDLVGPAVLGASMWLLPPVFVAISLGWQNELPRGQGYVSVVWGYLGVAVLLACAWLALARRGEGSTTRGRVLASRVATLALAVLASATVAQSAHVARLVIDVGR